MALYWFAYSLCLLRDYPMRTIRTMTALIGQVTYQKNRKEK